MKNLLLFSVFIFILCSCKKPRTIKIVAKNAATEERYAGLSYTIVSSRTTANGEKYRTEAEGVLDENGEAVEEIKVKTGRSYSVRIGKLDNICYHNELHQYFDSPYDENGTFTYKFAECAYLKFRYNNINCINEFDQITVNRTTNLENYVGFIIPAVYNGCEDYTMPDFVQVPMGNWYFHWEVTKNGITNNYYDTLFLNAGEQKYYEFNY
jgi:hypothetical protein